MVMMVLVVGVLGPCRCSSGSRRRSRRWQPLGYTIYVIGSGPLPITYDMMGDDSCFVEL